MPEEKNQQPAVRRPRNLAFDVMNVLSCLAVIALHHNALVHSFHPTRGWVQSLVVECVCYWAVPVFMMISGATLMNYRDRYSTGAFFKKRVLRTVIPWFGWSVILLFWKVGTGQMTLSPPLIRNALDLIVHYKVETVYWFFGELFACYLALPVFSLLRGERRVLWYVVGLNFLFRSCLPVLGTWLHFSWSLSVPVVGSLFIFVLLGYLLTSGELSRKQRLRLYVLGIACLVFRFCYTYHYSFLKGTTDTTIKGYTMFHGVLYSAAVFVWFSRLPWEDLLPAWLKNRLPWLASHSFGVFLIHRLVMYYEQRLLPIGGGILWQTIGVIPTYLISLLIIAGLRKIPVLRRLTG